MKKSYYSSWKTLAMTMAMLAVPMLVAAATPPNAPANPLYPPGIGWHPKVDYAKPNFAYSPNIRKFVDSLPGLGATHANNLGQYIPVAVPDVATFSGLNAGTGTALDTANPASDYYELEVGQYNKQMHSDLPGACTTSALGVTTCAGVNTSATTLRGYAQINSTVTNAPNGVQQYLGPAIIAKSYDPTKPAGLNGNGKPVRIKYFNKLPANSLLPLPVDTTIMGAGLGANGGIENYSQNRATIHLHGGATPWISDGTPHQWITPVGELTSYFKGLSFQNVPDMINGSTVNGTAVPCRGGATCFTAFPNDGIGTLYYTNEQSARLMFYHDHAYGTTRLNVYDGMAAPYLLYDQYEQDMIDGTNLYGVNPTNAKFLPDQAALGAEYKFGIPLVIQDKSFVNDVTTGANVVGSPAALAFAATQAANPTKTYVHTDFTLTTDPLWQYYVNTTGGNLWMPHEYMPIENPFDPTGSTPNGRWDYAAFMIPPALPTNLTLPSPTLIPETFADTMVVNGTAFPYATLPPDALRFRILNACNDRTVNLQLYYAYDPIAKRVCNSVTGGFTAANCTEVSMVAASPNPAFPTWPIDGRDGGVPDPANAGPPWFQIGNEGGFLAKVAVTPTQPIDYETSRQNMPLGGVTSHSLLMLPAVRADVIVDLSSFKTGDVLMVYNDAPAPMPGFWPSNDFFTDDPDQRGVGAAPTTPPGFGPNTRTVMQIRVSGAKASNFDFSSTAKPGFIRNNAISSTLPAIDTASEGASLTALKLMLPKVFAASQPAPIVPQEAYNTAYPSGPHYHNSTTTPRTDSYVMGYQTTLNVSGAGTPLAKIKTTLAGNNYIVGTVPTAPTVMIIGGGGTGAVATAGLNPIGAITLLTGGAGYPVNSSPKVTLGAPAAAAGTGAAAISVQATAVATTSGGAVNAITIDEPGANYTNIVTAPTCTVAPPNTPALTGDITATCSVMINTLNTVGSIVLTGGLNSPGSGYTRQPQIILVPPKGSNGLGATAVAMLTGDLAMTGKNLTEGFDVEFGRMDIRLGSTPNPLTPGVGAGFVLGLARYIDPPTEIMNDGETIIWRLSHLGVDSHAMHFHLFNMQVINRVDWANVLYPPYPDEIGWKETIRTNPMQDLIVAIRPTSQVLPFPIPNSNRVLDPTTPQNSTTNFYPVAPPVGVPAVAQQSNVMTNFGWEYVWHCHLLGHEENDMMRPMVLSVASAAPLAPTTPTATLAAGTGNIAVAWAAGALTTPANAPTGYLVERTVGAAAFTTLTTIYDNTIRTYADTVPVSATPVTYIYRITAFNTAGSTPSGTRNRIVAAFTAPTVTLLSASGTTFTAPATIPLTATAAGGGTATVKQVDYYSGSSLIGTSTTATGSYPFSFGGANVGTYSLTAKVTNSLGATTVSAPVVVTVLATASAAVMATPASPSVLAGASVAFTWNNVVGAGGYSLWVGTSQGASDIANLPTGLTTAVVANGLPTNGSTVYVRLYTLIGTTWSFNDYTYTASGTVSAAVMSNPVTNGSILTGASQTFSWNNVVGAGGYSLWVGTTLGASDIANLPTGGTSVVANGLPTNGSTVYVRLYTLIGTTWLFNDYTYTASGTVTAAVISSPATNGSTLTSASQTFTWNNVVGAGGYSLWVGTTLGASDIANLPTGGTSVVANGLPTNGSTVYVRLYTLIGTTWLFNDYTYTASGAATPAAMTTPANLAILTGATQTFNWNNAGAAGYSLWVGTTLGASNIANIPTGTGTSAIATGFPGLGTTVYVRLYSLFGTTWLFNDYSYTSN
jgi:FtsP/CotA-like multicopper oxidase with cupredoxin domain